MVLNKLNKPPWALPEILRTKRTMRTKGTRTGAGMLY